MKILSAILVAAFAAVLLSSAKAEARPEAEYGPWGPFWVFSPDWTCPEGQTEKNADLFRAAAYDLKDRVRELLDCGADINGRNYIGQTPLHWAMYLEDPGMANYLIAEGADPSATRRDGLTAAVAAKINWHRKTSRTCADDEEVNPFNVRECRPKFSCSGEMRETAENVCGCPAGLRENPFQPGTCRRPFSCPAGKVEVANYECEISCPVGHRENPFEPGTCRPAFSCPEGTTEIEEYICRDLALYNCAPGTEPDPFSAVGLCRVVALSCPPGQEKNPFEWSCRQPFSCPPGEEEVRDGVCECELPTERIGSECTFASVQSCGGAGMFYDFASGVCVESCGAGTELRASDGVCRPIVCRGVDDNHCSELGRSHGALAVNLHFAHAQVLADGTPLLGKGVTIGVSEVGALHWIPDGGGSPTTHSELPEVPVFRYTAESPRATGTRGYYDGESVDALHGIAVLGVMAAKKDGRGLTGIAPEADYLYALSSTPNNVNIAEGYHNLVANGAGIINSSWGADDYRTAHHYLPADGENVMESARANLRTFVKVRTRGYPELDDWLRGKFSSADSLPAPADRPIYVRSAGNQHGFRMLFAVVTVKAADGSVLRVLRDDGTKVNATVPGVLAGLPEFFPELTLNNLAVAAVQYERSSVTIENGVTLRQAPIWEHSNRCGAGNDSFCLVAPGEARHWVTREEYERIKEISLEKAYEEPICHDRAVWEWNSPDRAYCRAVPHTWQYRGGRQPTDGRESVRTRYFVSLYAELVAEKFRRGHFAEFLLAPETDEYTQREPYSPTGYDQSAGTSLAAPMVSGALALMKQYFMAGTNCGAGDLCGLGSHELVARILATADKRGIYADSSIYGAGLLDLKNALTPQGELQLLSGESVGDSESHSLSQSALQTGPAFGDSIGHALRNVRMAAFDEMNAPFPVAAAGLIQSESENESLREALSAMQHKKTTAPQTQWDFADGFGWWSLRGASRAGQPEIKSIFGADNAYANPYSALAGDGMSAGLEWDSLRVAMFGETPGQETLARGAVGSFSFAPFSETMENGGWILHFGGVDELNGFLSSSGSGAFGDLRSRTAFVGADYVGEKINGWRIRLGGFAGDTSADNGEWFAGTESLRSDSFHLGVERENIFYSGDGLGFRLHQPLRASGSLKIRIPTGRTRYGDLTWREVSGKTSGRELSLEGLYRRSFDGGSWRVSAGAVSEPGHRADAKTIGRMLFAFEREF